MQKDYDHALALRNRLFDGVKHLEAVTVNGDLKVMSSMDLAERRKPQDGRIKLKISKSKAIDFRVNTLPTLWGEKVVLRILDSDSAKMGIDAQSHLLLLEYAR